MRQVSPCRLALHEAGEVLFEVLEYQVQDELSVLPRSEAHIVQSARRGIEIEIKLKSNVPSSHRQLKSFDIPQPVLDSLFVVVGFLVTHSLTGITRCYMERVQGLLVHTKEYRDTWIRDRTDRKWDVQIYRRLT